MRHLLILQLIASSILMLLPSFSYAITNIEKERTSKAEAGWNGNLRFKFSGKDGNNEQTEWGIGSHIRWSNSAYKWLNWYSRDYERNNGYRTDDETFLHTRLIQNHQQTIATEYFIQYEQAPFAGLKRRLLLGTGIRWHNWSKINTGNQQSSGDSFQGLGIFNEQIREVDLGSTQIEQRYRGNVYSHWLYQAAGERAISTSATLYLQPDLADSDDVKVLLQAQLTLPITEQLHLQWKWQSNWDSRPPSGVSKEVHETKMQLKYSF
jgi:putative salt-induced outer membrane protein YdiY